MTRRKGLVLDANILLRAVFGQRVRELLEAFEDAVTFIVPMCVSMTRENISPMSQLAAGSIRFRDWLSWRKLETSWSPWQSLYQEYETTARERVTPPKQILEFSNCFINSIGLQDGNCTIAAPTFN